MVPEVTKPGGFRLVDNQILLARSISGRKGLPHKPHYWWSHHTVVWFGSFLTLPGCFLSSHEFLKLLKVSGSALKVTSSALTQQHLFKHLSRQFPVAQETGRSRGSKGCRNIHGHTQTHDRGRSGAPRRPLRGLFCPQTPETRFPIGQACTRARLLEVAGRPPI